MNRSDIADAAAPAADDGTQAGQRIRLLSYNVQAGISTARYRHYVTHSWKHVLPHPQRFNNLDRVARLVSDYDVIGLQEVDAGSLRSGYVNLTQYISERAGLPFWYDQTNRRIGRIARHSTGLLSRFGGHARAAGLSLTSAIRPMPSPSSCLSRSGIVSEPSNG